MSFVALLAVLFGPAMILALLYGCFVLADARKMKVRRKYMSVRRGEQAER